MALTVLMVCMMVITVNAYAAGSHNINGKYEPKDSSGNTVKVGETTYKAYLVGDFDEENPSLLKLFPQYAGVDAGLNFTKKQFDEEGLPDEEANKWREAWMGSAETLSNYVKDDDLKGTVSTSDGKFTFTGLENGLYLLTGTSSEVEGADGKSYWWPRPMYVLVHDEDAEVSMKPATENVDTYTVHKTWEKIPEDLDELVKPKKIEVTILYDGKEKETVELSDENNWMYKWDAGKDEKDPSLWTVQEVITDEIEKSFSVTISEKYDEATRSKVIDIKNTYDRKELEIAKTMEDFISQGATMQTFVFKVTGYAGEKQVFERFAGLTFGENTAETDKALVKNIPKNVDRIVVTESYTGNYKPDQDTKEAKLEPTEDGKGLWTVSFTNRLDKPDEPPTFDTGVINQYSITGNGTFAFKARKGSGVE